MSNEQNVNETAGSHCENNTMQMQNNSKHEYKVTNVNRARSGRIIKVPLIINKLHYVN